MSRAAGFDCVPVTVFIDGPLGPGSLQVWVESEDDAVARLVDLVPSRKVPKRGWFRCVEGLGADDTAVAVIHADDPALRRLAVFDVLVNNADRKGGHILSSEGHLFGIDHGVTFHVENKLRTLLWGWGGSELTEDERDARAPGPRRGPGRPGRPARRRGDRRAAPDAPTACSTATTSRARAGQWPSIPWPPF